MLNITECLVNRHFVILGVIDRILILSIRDCRLKRQRLSLYQLQEVPYFFFKKANLHIIMLEMQMLEEYAKYDY